MCRSWISFYVVAAFIYVALGQEDIVNTPNGVVQGIVGDVYRVFKGIPYATPPVGDLRWAPTVAAQPWPGVLNATVFSAGCPQHCELPPHTCPVETSEDCLYLNVWTPRLKYITSKLPVMLWFPGGRFEQGEAGSDLYNGMTLMNSSQFIMVTSNYRLGALGFLTTDSVSGNFGFLDQIQAMKWVQENIEAFGGDPTQVTLAGQSAGASSIGCHLVSPLSKGLFVRAIAESDPFTLVMKSEENAQFVGGYFLGFAGCNDGDWECLRNLSVDTIINAQTSAQKKINYFHPMELFLPWTPVVDGEIVPVDPMSGILQGQFNHVPILLGDVRDDALLFVYQAANGYVTEVEYIAAVTWVFGDAAPAVLEEYPPHNIFDRNDSRPLLAKLGTDYVFACSNRAVIRALSEYVPVYFYQFNHVISFDCWGPQYPFCVGVVCHGSELPFVFHSAAPYYSFTPEEELLSQYVMTYWTNFIASGDPNNSTDAPPVQWPAYNATSDTIILLDVPLQTVSGLRAEVCDFWDQEGYSHGL